MNKKRKLILKFWIIFIVIILLILLFLLGLRLSKLFKLPKMDSQQKQEQIQYQYQYQYIYDTNKVENIIGLINSLKRLKQLKEFKNKQQEETQPINNKDFVSSQEEAQYQFDWNSNYDNDDNKLIKDIAVVSLATGAVIIGCVVLTPVFASISPIAAPIALLL
ncbi:MAG: hypothetical protein ACQBVK_04230 [Candidatus Phytoplasma sp. TWB_XP]